MESPLPLLLEIGVEELPSSFVDAALEALPQLVAQKLTEARLPFGTIHAHGTPRRLAVLVDDLAHAQADLDEDVIGPPEAAAFKDGQPTRAAEAFAQKLGIGVDALSVVLQPAVGNKKAGRYLVGRKKEKGRTARELLAPVLTSIASSIPFKKSMRWGDGEATFGRPVQWLVALLGNEVVPMTFAGKKSGRETRGHRFLAPGSIELDAPASYVSTLRAAHVLVDRKERADTMMEKVTAAAIAAGGVHDPEPYLVDENASLVEEPHVVVGSFEPRFLELPAAVIRAVARGHQKYFCVQKSDDELLPMYLAVANTANDPVKVAKGNDRVMRARLADASFFFEEDKKAELDTRVEKLAGIVFHARLGTVREKVARLELLTAHLGERLELSEDTQRQARRAAHLCKSDLVSLMVGEFPELQGHMGRAYARHANEDPRVADAIRDHYRPVGATDGIAADDVSLVVALADRMDTLVGCFAIGLSPTGAADPYALRRSCIAALRTLMEAKSPGFARLDFGELVGAAYDLFFGSPGKKLELSREATITKVSDFAKERLRGILTLATGGGVAEAVLGGHAWVSGKKAPIESHPAFALAKAKALASVVEAKEPWLEQARMVAKRLAGISKDAAPVRHGRDVFSGSAKDEAIVGVVHAIDEVTATLTDTSSVTTALNAAEQLAKRVDDIFVTTLVNDPNDPLTPKRLEVLSFGAECMLRIGDFSRLV